MGEIIEILCMTKNKDCVINLYEYMKFTFNKENIFI